MMKKKEQLEAYQKWVRQELARSVDSVSYTHLDVYKRQM